AIGGRFFNIALSSDHHINPFDLPIPGPDETPADVLRSNIITLVGLFRIMLGGLTPEEDSIVDRAIGETYALKDISPESDFRTIEPPLLSDFEMVLSGMEGSDSVLQRLLKFTKGSWKNFINQPTNVDINRRFVVFSVRDMEDDLKPVAMYIVTHFIWLAVRKTLKKRLLIVDEAWWMMKSDDTASFLYAIAKRGRKYYLGLCTITQDVADFINAKYGKPIVTNSSMQLLLKQSPSSVDVLQKTFNLTDEEKYLLLESGVGEGIFFAGLKHVAIKVIASYTEDQIVTSDPSQLLAIAKNREDLEAEEEDFSKSQENQEHMRKQESNITKEIPQNQDERLAEMREEVASLEDKLGTPHVHEKVLSLEERADLLISDLPPEKELEQTEEKIVKKVPIETEIQGLENETDSLYEELDNIEKML
ncbi:MAG: conjugal transfer ATP-binding protein TraC, partial [Flavobacteriaceae bacterium]